MRLRRLLYPINKTIWEQVELMEGKDLVQALFKHFKELPSILSKFNIDINSLQMIARGDKGTAFTDGKYVVKITEDRNEASASAHIAGRNVPGVNRIHYVAKFKSEIPYQEEGDEEPIDTLYYLIIQDLLSTNLTNSEKTAANMTGDFLSGFSRKIPWPFDQNQVARHIVNHHYQKTGEIVSMPSITNAIKTLLAGVLNLHQYHITFLDVSADNVGKDQNGNLILFDLGVSNSPPVHFGTIQ